MDKAGLAGIARLRDIGKLQDVHRNTPVLTGVAPVKKVRKRINSPTPEEIEKRCAIIRSKWSEEERISRMGGLVRLTSIVFSENGGFYE